MELEDLWKSGDMKSTPETIQIPDRQRLNQPVDRIRKALDVNIVFAVLLGLFNIYARILFRQPLIQAGILILIAGHVWSINFTLCLRKTILQTYNETSPLLETLQLTASAVRRWIFISEYSGIIFYPVAVATGFMAGGWQGSGLPIAEFMGKPYVIIAFALAIALLVPISFISTRLLIKISFLKYLRQLENNIRDMDPQYDPDK
jgi:hypothetical protein